MATYTRIANLRGPKGDSGMSAPEVQALVDARVPESLADDGTIRDAALDAMNSAAASTVVARTFDLTQTDYVELLRARASTNRMQVQRTASYLYVSCYNEAHHITYRFQNPQDDYWYVGDVWTGAVDWQTNQSREYAALTRTGVFNDSGQTAYTTEIGAKFSTTITVEDGGRIAFQHYVDARGGRWQFTRDGNSPVIVSTWNTIGSIDRVAALWNNLAAGTYQVEATFLGADPANPPAEGADARGWLGYVDGRSHIMLGQSRQMVMTTMLAPISNRDIALRIAPTSGGSAEFVPYHGLQTAVSVSAPRFVYGDSELLLEQIPLNAKVQVSSFAVVQNTYGRNPASGATNLIQFWTTQTITPDAVLSISGRWKALQAVVMNRGYVMMGPASSSLFNLFQTSMRNEYTNNPDQYGQDQALSQESDVAESFLFLSTLNADVGIAFRYTNPGETIRRGGTGKKPVGDRSFLERRNSTMVKHYQHLYEYDTVVPEGTVHRFSGDYIHTVARGIRDQLRLS